MHRTNRLHLLGAVASLLVLAVLAEPRVSGDTILESFEGHAGAAPPGLSLLGSAQVIADRPCGSMPAELYPQVPFVCVARKYASHSRSDPSAGMP